MAIAALREELDGMAVGALRQRAAQLGVASELVEEARDGADPKGDIIELILARASPPDAGHLESLSVGELRSMAQAAGIDAGRVEQARDAHDPRAELIALVLEQSRVDRPELEAMSVGELRGKAAAVGVDAGLVEAARDGADPKGELIELILAKARPAHGGAADKEALREELQQHSVGSLRHTASSKGVSDTEVERARDADNPKKELIDLILGALTPRIARLSSRRSTASSFAGPEPEPEADAEPSPARSRASSNAATFRAIARLSPLGSNATDDAETAHAATVIQTEWRAYDARGKWTERVTLHREHAAAMNQQERARAERVFEELLLELAPELMDSAVRSSCSEMATGHITKRRSRQKGAESVADMILRQYVESSARAVAHGAIADLVHEHFLNRATNAVMNETLQAMLTTICEETLLEAAAEAAVNDLLGTEIGTWVRLIANDALAEMQGADSAEATRQDAVAADTLVEEQVLNELLLRGLTEVVRSEANGVMTDEVVEQLLDTTLAVACVERAVTETGWAATVDDNVVLQVSMPALMPPPRLPFPQSLHSVLMPLPRFCAQDWHGRAAASSSVEFMIGRLGTLVSAWENEESATEAAEQAKRNAAEIEGLAGEGLGANRRAVGNVVTQAKALELQRSEAALREWLAQEEQAQQEQEERRLPTVLSKVLSTD